MIDDVCRRKCMRMMPQTSKIGETPWTVEDMTILYEQRTYHNTPYSKIAEMIKRTKDSCYNKFRITKWADTTIPNHAQESIKTRRVEAEKVKISKTVEQSLDRFRMRSDVIADKLSQSVTVLPPAPLKTWEPKNRVKTSHAPEDMGLLLSDLHIGHEHTSEETGGLSEYSVDIFKQRLYNLQYAVADIYELHSTLYDIPALHIFSLGDIVDGMNEAGAWSPVYISTPIYDQVVIGFEELSRCIWYWLSIFKDIHFYGIRGNHGRVAKSGAEKDYNNWDNIIYKMLQLKFQDNPRIHFHVPQTWWMMKTIRKHKFLMVHGDDVKAKSPPVKSFLDFEQKMTGIIKEIPNYTLAGHFHNASEFTTHNGRCIINGSFVGGDVYSLRNYMPGAKPEQKLFGIHDTRGITYTYNIGLDEKREVSNMKKGKK
jgi:hypothetical protein